MQASARHRFLGIRYTVGVPGIPPTNAGRLYDADINQMTKALGMADKSASQPRASERRRFLVTRYTVGVPGIPPLTPGVCMMPI